MRRACVMLTAFALVAFSALCGCGGGGGGGGGGGIHSPYDGTYYSDFTRAPDTSIIIFVARNNVADVIISDATGPIYSGSGTLDPTTQAFTATTDQSMGGALHVQITGTAVLGNPNVLNLTLTGAMSKTLTVPRVLGEDLTLLAGTYTVTQTADSGSGGSGTGTVTFAQDASWTGTINLTGGGVITFNGGYLPPVGSGGFLGTTTIQGSTVTFNYQGSFWLFNGTRKGSGTYDSTNNLHGTWTAVAP